MQMKIRLWLIGIGIIAGAVILACSSGNSGAPGVGDAHPPRYVVVHGAEAAADLASCQVCHGLDFQGTTNPVPSCFSCHSSGPPFTIHPVPYVNPADHGAAAKADALSCRKCHGDAPNNFSGGIVADPTLFNRPAGTCSNCHSAARAHPTNWQGSNEDTDLSYSSSHRSISERAVSESCALCHQTTGPGAGPFPGAPSCYNATFTNADGYTSGCHAGGFNVAPHGIPYRAANQHGAASKNDLAYCQQCHGITGTTRFSGGIAPTSCAACHPAAEAHPVRWQGGNDITGDYLSSHRTAHNFDTACAICHNVTADAPGPNAAAPSCFSAGFTNADGVAGACHAAGPGVSHGIPYAAADLHGAAAKADLGYCQQCHGMPGTIQFNGGIAATSCSTAACHPAAGAHPARWHGNNDITPGYLSTHRNAGSQNTACSICHDFSAGRTAPDPAAPSCFQANFTNSDGTVMGCHAAGPGAPHALPFADKALHGPEAKKDLTYCQQCHAAPSDGGPGSNPRFNAAIGDLANGCEDCHSPGTAHPYPYWMGAAANSHKTAGNIETACTLCHGANLQGGAEGGVGLACGSCHQAGSPLTALNCTSCHNTPPNGGAPAGNVRPNRAGAHGVHDALAKVAGQCGTCHNGSGTETDVHYDTSAPAAVSILPAYRAETGAFSYNAGSGSCSGVSCHGGQATPDWYNGSIDVNTNCSACHASGTTQYNSYTGRHNTGDHPDLSCTYCHDTAKLAAGHFAGLDTSGFEQSAGLTIVDALGYDPGTQEGCSVAGCHGTERW